MGTRPTTGYSPSCSSPTPVENVGDENVVKADNGHEVGHFFQAPYCENRLIFPFRRVLESVLCLLGLVVKHGSTSHGKHLVQFYGSGELVEKLLAGGSLFLPLL